MTANEFVKVQRLRPQRTVVCGINTASPKGRPPAQICVGTWDLSDAEPLLLSWKGEEITLGRLRCFAGGRGRAPAGTPVSRPEFASGPCSSQSSMLNLRAGSIDED
jgi:hypothetical protein